MKFDGPDFRCDDRVSVWVSNYPYADIPDSYFDEDFRCKGGAPVNEWAGNYGFGFYDEERLATNGAMEGLMSLKQALQGCSFSASFIKPALAQAKEDGMENISWIILLYDFDYQPDETGVSDDKYTRFLGAFDYDEEV